MAEHQYDPPPTKIGEIHSYIAGSGKIIHVKRLADNLLEIQFPEDPSFLPRVIEEGNVYHLSGYIGSLGASSLHWHEVIDNF